MAHDVFISYSTTKKEVAKKVRAALEAHGIACWMAPESIPYGALYTDSLADAVVQTRIILVIFCAEADASPWVHKEVERAIHYKKIPLLFRIEDVEPTRGLGILLSGTQWFTAFPPPIEPYLDPLARALQTAMGRTDAPPELPPQKLPTPRKAATPKPKTAQVTEAKMTETKPPAISLMQAAENGDAETVAAWLRRGADLDHTDSSQWTALMRAAEKGHTGIVRTLLDHGAAVDTVNNRKRTALMEAVSHGQAEAAAALLDSGANVNAVESSGWTALHLAADHHEPELIHLLLSRGTDADLLTQQKETALSLAQRRDASLAALLEPKNRKKPVWPQAVRGKTVYESATLTPQEAKTGGPHPITTPSGKVEVAVPAGVTDGQRVTFEALGGAGWHGGDSGPLIVTFQVLPGWNTFAGETGRAVVMTLWLAVCGLMAFMFAGFVIDTAWSLYDSWAAAHGAGNDTALGPNETALSHAARMMTATHTLPKHDVGSLLLPYGAAAGGLLSLIGINSEENEAKCGPIPRLIGSACAGAIGGYALSAGLHAQGGLPLLLPLLGAILGTILSAAAWYIQQN